MKKITRARHFRTRCQAAADMFIGLGVSNQYLAITRNIYTHLRRQDRYLLLLVLEKRKNLMKLFTVRARNRDRRGRTTTRVTTARVRNIRMNSKRLISWVKRSIKTSSSRTTHGALCSSLVPRPHPQEEERVWYLMSEFLVVLRQHVRKTGNPIRSLDLLQPCEN